MYPGKAAVGESSKRLREDEKKEEVHSSKKYRSTLLELPETKEITSEPIPSQLPHKSALKKSIIDLSIVHAEYDLSLNCITQIESTFSKKGLSENLSDSINLITEMLERTIYSQEKAQRIMGYLEQDNALTDKLRFQQQKINDALFHLNEKRRHYLSGATRYYTDEYSNNLEWINLKKDFALNVIRLIESLNAKNHAFLLAENTTETETTLNLAFHLLQQAIYLQRNSMDIGKKDQSLEDSLGTLSQLNEQLIQCKTLMHLFSIKNHREKYKVAISRAKDNLKSSFLDWTMEKIISFILKVQRTGEECNEEQAQLLETIKQKHRSNNKQIFSKKLVFSDALLQTTEQQNTEITERLKELLKTHLETNLSLSASDAGTFIQQFFGNTCPTLSAESMQVYLTQEAQTEKTDNFPTEFFSHEQWMYKHLLKLSHDLLEQRLQEVFSQIKIPTNAKKMGTPSPLSAVSQASNDTASTALDTDAEPEENTVFNASVLAQKYQAYEENSYAKRYPEHYQHWKQKILKKSGRTFECKSTLYPENTLERVATMTSSTHAELDDQTAQITRHFSK